MAPAPVRKRENNTSLENWLGRNVLGIAASELVFIGLIFLGVLVYKYITETVKILLMYALSGIITGLGAFLSAKGRNNFTLGPHRLRVRLFFHLHFAHAYLFRAAAGFRRFRFAAGMDGRHPGDLPVARSTLLSVVAHAGMIISLCFAFARAFP